MPRLHSTVLSSKMGTGKIGKQIHIWPSYRESGPELLPISGKPISLTEKPGVTERKHAIKGEYRNDFLQGVVDVSDIIKAVFRGTESLCHYLDE